MMIILLLLQLFKFRNSPTCDITTATSTNLFPAVPYAYRPTSPYVRSEHLPDRMTGASLSESLSDVGGKRGACKRRYLI